MKPKQIKLIGQEELFIKWDDGKESKINLKLLRDECPCAVCKGETVLFRTYKPPKLKLSSPDVYILKEIKPVGTYAIQLYWQDNHNTGIYTWDVLQSLGNAENNQNYEPLV
ncbi:MAG: DUF971 domain-containing protein [Bacteroidota bacterium]|nr:DUF971 domain-containing protein [Bacteroidota bacterium]